MKYKLLAIDLDDTLLNDQLEISEDNKKAIIEMEKMGIHVVFCSGRAKDSMMKYVKEVGVHEKEDYIISYNGAVIDRFDGERVFYKPISGEDLKELIEAGRQHNIDTQLYTDEIMVEKYTDKTQQYEKLSGLPVKVVSDLKEVKESIKVLYNHVAGEALEELRLELMAKFDDTFNIFYSKSHYIEVLHKEANKGLAVKNLAESLGINQEEVVAIGDGFNDVSMIKYAGLGIAVKNAHEGVKVTADYITESENNENAIWEVYEKFIK
ncbi:Cof-type HAD-IIB family hydrolase [Petrocella sp. FN5]|uniref:Cof-type HAD-IIB family hydrolase n=1 Tax=Petrocella sp. FN5 TaxID=3032002 RepID=UPI0023D9C9BD|nr:Cof-type HAD-IIB family hydrolase [Petrocella sp. FN5]MDF1617429.1 Cof-type HAD-IIB family hydrolase [Petrocella sp. FN5]